MSFWKYMNEFFQYCAPTLDATDKLIGMLMSAGLFYLGYHANGIAKSNLELVQQDKQSRKYQINKDEREIFRAVYRNLSNALGLVFRDGHVSDEALALFWQARDQARLELPVDIYEYSENLLEAARNAFAIHRAFLSQTDLPIDTKRKEKVKEHESYILTFIKAKPYEQFAKYMRMEAV